MRHKKLIWENERIIYNTLDSCVVMAKGTNHVTIRMIPKKSENMKNMLSQHKK